MNEHDLRIELRSVFHPVPEPEAEKMRQERIEVIRKRGVDIRPWHPGFRFYLKYGEGCWIDHPYRLKGPNGQNVYVSEPYELGPRAIQQLAKMVEDGWNVTIRADDAIWYPGRTLAIYLHKKKNSR